MNAFPLMRPQAVTRIRLTRKLANRLNGVDLSNFHVGDILNLSATACSILIDAGWAEPCAEPSPAEPAGKKPSQSDCAE